MFSSYHPYYMYQKNNMHYPHSNYSVYNENSSQEFVENNITSDIDNAAKTTETDTDTISFEKFYNNTKNSDSQNNNTKNRKTSFFSLSENSINLFGMNLEFDDLIIIGIILLLLLQSEENYIIILVLGLILLNIDLSILNIF